MQDASPAKKVAPKSYLVEAFPRGSVLHVLVVALLRELVAQVNCQLFVVSPHAPQNSTRRAVLVCRAGHSVGTGFNSGKSTNLRNKSS